MNDLKTLSQTAIFVIFAIFLYCLVRYLLLLRMDYASAADNDETSETEELLLSDSEEHSTVEKDEILSVDYNARIVFQDAKCFSAKGDDCDTQCHENGRSDFCKKLDCTLNTSTEDINISDEEEICSKPVNLHYLNLDGTAKVGDKMGSDTYSMSCTSIISKEGYATDDEYLSDDDNHEENISGDKSENSRKFMSAISIAGLTTAIKPASGRMPSSKKALSDFNVTNIFSNSLLIDENDLIDLTEEPQSPLMTCLEFLKNPNDSDGNHTDAEDLSVGSVDEIKPEPLQKLWENGQSIPSRNNLLPPEDRRRKSSGVEVLTEDETFSMENSCNPRQRKIKKRNIKLVAEDHLSEDSNTDEEIFGENNIVNS